jgi:hypothetical protein
MDADADLMTLLAIREQTMSEALRRCVCPSSRSSARSSSECLESRERRRRALLDPLDFVTGLTCRSLPAFKSPQSLNDTPYNLACSSRSTVVVNHGRQAPSSTQRAHTFTAEPPWSPLTSTATVLQQFMHYYSSKQPEHTMARLMLLVVGGTVLAIIGLLSSSTSLYNVTSGLGEQPSSQEIDAPSKVSSILPPLGVLAAVAKLGRAVLRDVGR